MPEPVSPGAPAGAEAAGVQPAGMEAALWHAAIAVRDVPAGDGRPIALRLLGRELVAWRRVDGSLAVVDDRCPHRGSRLSLGRVEGGQLHCGYHGWQFDGGGQCVAIPALPGFVPPASHAVAAYPAVAAHGLWWVRLDAAQPGAGAPPALAGLPPREVVCGPFDAETSAPRAIENFLDTAHFAVVHDGWLGDRAHAAVPAYEVGATPDGRPLVAHYRAWQPQASASAQVQGGAWVDYRYEVLGPYSALLRKTSAAAGTDEAYAIWAAPTDEERCRIWFTMFTADGERPEAELAAFQTTIFLQDRDVLESQRPRRLPLRGGELHCAADRLSMAYRRWLRASGVRFGVC